MRAETIQQTRSPSLYERRGLSLVTLVVAVIISLAHMWMNGLGAVWDRYLGDIWSPPFVNVSTIHQNGFHFAGFVLLCVLVTPLVDARWARHGLPRAIDIAFGCAVAAAALYIVNAENAIYDRGVRLIWADWLAGSLCIIGALEFTRRTTGWIIPVLIVLALTYVTWWGAYVPGVFRFGGLSPETIMFRAMYGDDAMFGTIARISSTFVFMFILFGAFLLKSGAGDFIVDISRVVAGRFIGGPGFVAVMASGLTGTINGSAVANTASTGVITIPLMKRAGFPKHFAGGVEAAASTGGQLMPPIMGAGAFVMASFTQIPYTTIVTVSILPAILYFATVGFFVRIEAKRSNARALETEDGPGFWTVFRNGGPPFLIPVGLLIGLLVYGYTPTYAAGFAILTCVAASWLTPNRMGLAKIVEALELGARNMIMTGILLCAVGLIVNVITTAGIGNTFSLMIAQWSDGSLIVAIVLVALASLVLGMGLPVTAAYIVLATLSAPALNQLILQGEMAELIAAGQLPEQAKAVFMLAVPEQIAALSAPMPMAEARAILDAVPPESLLLVYDQAFDPATLTLALLSAHMIIFWLSQDSNVTPPVCLAAFTAAAIAESPPMKTGIAAWKVAKGLYFVPLLFAYTPFLSGDWPQMLEIFAFALPGLWAVSAAIQGHWENRLNPAERVLTLAVGATLMWPIGGLVHLAALGAFVALFWWNVR